MSEIDLVRLDDTIRSNAEALFRNFFSRGRKSGGEWKMADYTGAAGNSLGIQLTGPKAGVWHDRATGKGGTFVELLMLNRGITFPEAIELVERALGISLRKAPEPFGNSQWQECVKRMTLAKRKALCAYRNYSAELVDWLVDRSLIGIFKDKHGVERWAFPVQHDGKVAAVHCEIQKDEQGHKRWFYFPKLSDLGLKVAPFVLGDLSNAAEVHIHESQWDLLAHADIIGFDTESQGICLMATRGSANGALAGVVNKLEAKNYLWPQRDIADENGKIPAKEWLRQVQATLRRAAYVCWIPDLTPDRDFDFNDWCRSGKICSDNLDQIMGGAELFEPPAPEKKIPPFAAGLESDYGAKPETDGHGVETPNGDAREEQEDFSDFNRYPEIDPAAFHGVTGKLTRAIEPHTEADSIAIQTQLLIASGCAIGHGPYFRVGATKHFTNLDACLVGRTSRGRKGSAWDFAVLVMKEADCPWVGTCMTSGLSSGEGLIYAVRDPVAKKEQIKKNGKYTGEIQEHIADFGVDDKRLFVTEAEFSRPLKAMSRENNILSEVIRSSWDHGNLRSMVKNNPYQATGAHVSIVGHITREELHTSLVECSFFNGFANRFLWLCVQRSKVLPFGGDFVLEHVRTELNELKAAIAWAREVEEMERDPEANKLWESVYEELSADIPGRFGAAIGRGEGQVLRLSMVYALLDKSRMIKVIHLLAALALWKYCVASARYLFLSSLDNPHAAKILSALRQRPKGMTRTEIRVEILKGNLSKAKTDEAFNYLHRLKLAFFLTETREGRPTERWFATPKKSVC
jgi:hypothetical protein